jgi:hypothetical protein
MADCAKAASQTGVERQGVNVYVNSFGHDGKGYDIHIDPADTKGIAIFRDFAKQMAEHYKILSDGR